MQSQTEQQNKYSEGRDTLDIIFNVVFFLLVALFIFGGYQYYSLAAETSNKEAKIADLKWEIRELQEDFNKKVSQLNNQIDDLRQDKLTLVNAYQSERQESREFQEQVNRMSDELQEFKKLQEIDEEILKKYSKNFFLNENYKPSSLTEIDEKYVYNNGNGDEEPEKIHTKVYPFLVKLMEAARRDGVEIYVQSAYRSFEEQSDLKSKYEVIYGEGTANAFSAEQGYSEHQLGTTVDFTTPSLDGAVVEEFENTKAFKWLRQNAYKYGFILSYPKDNQYYVYEPWHWRFVGQELASDLHSKDIHFYEMDQRKIDQYLINVFE